ncbi:MAG: putative sulfate exporter family transporter [Acidimicrobiia bacterium]|nr:putative sulfate exporter family transporter [Acidimicrobiia bacterium]MDJ0664278.1 putative sulfate exporter family transporter [Acidimicrobiia bacterium]
MKTTSDRQPGFIENLLLGTTRDQIPSLIPGVLLALAVVVASAVLAELVNAALGFDGLISFILVAIVLGMLIRNTVGLGDRFSPGLQFSLKKVLRLGIILLGIRLSLGDVLEIGGFGIPVVVGAVATGLIVAIAATRRLGLSDRLGALIAIGTGICGATAIVAAAPGLRAKEEEVAYAVANITIFGIAAMLLYPFLGDLIFAGDIANTGLFLGTSIHETAQVAGAGLIYDQSFNVTATPSVADVAVVAKLVRNVMMILVIPGVTYLYARNLARNGEDAGTGTRMRDMFPVFIIGFVVMAAIRSIGDAAVDGGGNAFGLWGAETWGDLTHWIRTAAEYTLATAMAAVGLGTSLAQLKGLGLKPFVVGIAAAASVGVVSIGLVSVFGPLISL